MSDPTDRSREGDPGKRSSPLPDDDAPLGASATLPLKGSDTAPRATRPPRKKVGFGRLVALSLLVVAAMAVVALLPVIRGAFQKTPKDRIGLSYGGGPIEGSHF